MTKTLHTALVAALTLSSAALAQPSMDYQFIPGVSPQPITERAGLRGKEDLEAFIDGVMSAHMKQNHFAGAQVAVVKDGKVFFSKGYGYADIEKRKPVDPATTLFRPGSVAKMFTWTAVMQLVEQGKLDLDADVNTYLTQFKIPATFDAPITLRNLLTHTPGLEDGGVGYLWAKNPESLIPLADSLAAHIPARVRPPTTNFADGSNSSYSNFGTALAGVIVENVSGMPFDDYIDKYILQPLGMTHSTFRQPVPPALAPDLATGYTFKNGGWQAYKHGFETVQFSPAGALSASTDDMAKFMIAHLNYGEYNGQRILKEETARLMQSRQMAAGVHANGSALGFFETWLNGRRIVGHWGDTLTFHTSWDLLPAEKVGIYVCYNTSHEAGSTIAREDLLRSFMDRYYPATQPKLPAPAADFKERAKRYVGSYASLRSSYTTVEAAFGLGGAAKVALTKDNTLMIAGGGQATQWVEVAPNTIRRIDRDEVLTFFENDKGEVTGLSSRLAFNPLYKLAWYQNPALHQFILGFAVLCFIIAIVSALRHWKSDRAAPAGARRARRLAALTGVLLIGFLVISGVSIAAVIDEIFFGFPAGFKVALALPILAIPLALLLAWSAVSAWREGWWTRYGRAQFSVIALFSLLFLWTLSTVNLIGWNFG